MSNTERGRIVFHCYKQVSHSPHVPPPRHLMLRLGGVEDAVEQRVGLPSGLHGVGLEEEEDHELTKEVLL